MNRVLTGRKKIYTDERTITRSNIIAVLSKAYAQHRMNACDMQFLLDYEEGKQELQRKKIVRPEIDIQVSDNAANYVTEFKLGYFWGNSIMLVQRGDKEIHNSDRNIDDDGISALNEMIQNGENIGKKDLELGRSVEVFGIGHQLVDIKTDFIGDGQDESYAHIYTLDSRNTFCVYYNGIGNKKVLSVTFVKRGGKLYFTCFTDTIRYDIVGLSGELVSETINPLGMNPIIEYERSTDRMGVFERHISDMDAMNILISDFCNDSSQKTMEIWWGNDINLPEDEHGDIIKPKSSDWILTQTSPNGNNPKIQALSSTYNSASSLTAISSRWNRILQKCKVPTQQESEGGGSTGSAMNLSSGWSAAEVDAMREEKLIESGKREMLALVIKAIGFVPTNVLSMESPLRKVHVSDVDFHFNRKRNYDLSIKANTFATLVSHGVNGRHALKTIDMFEDVEQVWVDSKDDIEKYQKNLFEKQSQQEESTGMSDNGDQANNSPIIDGMNTAKQNSGE